MLCTFRLRPTPILSALLFLSAISPLAAERPDHLPPGAVRRFGPVRQLAGNNRGLAMFTSDGRRLFAAAGEESIHNWDDLRQPPRTLLNPDDHRVASVGISADGKVLATGATDGTILLRDIETGKVIRKLLLAGDAVQDIAFSRDGSRWAVVGSDQKVLVLNRNDDRVETIAVDAGNILCLAFAGDFVLCGCDDGFVRILDVKRGRMVRAVKTGGAVRALAVTADGTTAFNEGHDSSLIAFAVATGAVVQTFGGHAAPIVSLSCAADGRLLASADADGSARIWDTASGEELSRIAVPDGVIALALSPDGRKLVLANRDRSIDCWDVQRGTCASLLVGHKREVEAVAFRDKGKALRSWDSDETITWQAATGKLLSKGKEDKPAQEKVVIAPGGRYRAMVETPEFAFPALVSVDTGKTVPLGGKLRHVNCLAFSPDALLLGGAGSDGQITLWECATGQIFAEFKAHEGNATSVAFALRGRTFATGGGDASVVVWDVILCAAPFSDSWAKPGDDELEAMWQTMQREPGKEAFTAMRALWASPEKAVPFLKSKLPPRIDIARIKGFIAQLDDDGFDLRERATQELSRLGRDAEQALRDALRGKPSAEMRRRIAALLDEMRDDDSARVRCWTRAVFVLKHIGTAQANEVLKLLAEGDRVTKAAEAARAALGQR